MAIKAPRLNIEYYPVQKEFIFNHYLLSTIMGPVGSGKSVACIMKLFIYAMCIQPSEFDGIRRSRWIIVRNTKPELKNTTIKTFLQWLGRFGTMKETDMNFYLKIGDVEAEFQFIAFADEKDSKKLLSLECTGMYFNELRELDERVWEDAQGRIGRYPSLEADGAQAYWDKEKAKSFGINLNSDEEEVNMKCIFSDTNPPIINSFFHKLFEKKLFDEETGADKNPMDFKLFKQPSGMSEFAENKKWLPKNYYEDMIKNQTQEKVDVMVHCKYGLGEAGLGIYRSHFKHDKNVQVNARSKYNNATKLVVGMDFGLNPACCIGQFIDGTYYIFEELYTTNNKKKGLTQFLSDDVLPALRKYKFHKMNQEDIMILGDPAGNQRNQLTGQNLFGELRKVGFYVRMDTFDNTIAPRLEAVKLLLHDPSTQKPKLIVDEKCQFIIDGFAGNYYYDKDKSGFKDTPMKNEYSHIQDAIQYACRHLIKHKNRYLDKNTVQFYYENNQPADSDAGY